MPELKIYTGPMHGGKTTRLLAALERYTYQNKRVVLFKPRIDTRGASDSVTTHSGLTQSSIVPVVRVGTGEDILEGAGNADIIAVDEMFMIPNAAKALIRLYAQGRTVLVSTLQLSFEPQAFAEVAELMPWATSIDICPAVCSKCNNDAHFTRRKRVAAKTIAGENVPVIQVGGAESYEPLCFGHYTELTNLLFDRSPPCERTTLQ